MTAREDSLARIEQNRRNYEALKAAGQGKAPLVLPPPTERGTALLPPGKLRRETIPGGWYWTAELKAGETLRIALLEGEACVSMVAWNAADTSERLNYADTIKVQWTAALGKGRVLFSDMGRVMFSLTEDTTCAHDALMGGSTPASNRKRYGQETLRNTRDNFTLAALKLGLEKRDVPPCISFFAPLRTDEAGAFVWAGTPRVAGDFVDLRAEMAVKIALSNCPHPLDPNPAYDPKPVEVIRFTLDKPGPTDLCRTATPEAQRGFENLKR